MIKIALSNLAVIVFLVGVVSIGKGGEMIEKRSQFKRASHVPASDWEILSEKKIYFGHQSVGFNIMEGISEILRENAQIKLRIIETADKSEIKNGVLAHSRIGQNRNPQSKIDEFVKFMEEGIAGNADIAFFKFCMVDFDTDTDAAHLFHSYKSSMEYLEGRFPNTRFVYVTVPITTDPPGLKKWIFQLRMLVKKVRGEPVYDIVSRTRFNNYLRDDFKGRRSFFDLAEAEATSSDGKRFTLKKDGDTYLQLVPEYTYDGGHLNEVGRRKIAEDLLLFLLAEAGR